MGNIFFTSDTHYSHRNIIEHCDRPFASVEEMDEAMIERWNGVVKPDDTVYHLGDFVWKARKLIPTYLEKLNGKIHMLVGNHDDPRMIKMDCFESVGHYKELKIPDEEASHGRILICMSHYPILSWKQAHHGSWHLHGHSHGPYDIKCPGCGMKQLEGRRMVNVDVDSWDYTPVSFDQIRDIMKDRVHIPVDHHEEDTGR